MKQEEYFFKETALFKLSVGIRQVLQWDCNNFGFIKNKKPNICGLLNRLLPELSVYRDDLHEEFLRHYKGNAELVQAVENGIYGVYLRSFDLNDDACVDVPFRVNASNRQAFELIYEEKLQKYGLDFTNYVRTLLGEYAIKPYYQRELYFYYSFTKEIKRVIKECNICRYSDGKSKTEFIPISVEPFFASESANCLLGIDASDHTPVILPYRNADQIRITEKVGFTISEEEYAEVVEAWDSFSEQGGEEEDVRE